MYNVKDLRKNLKIFKDKFRERNLDFDIDKFSEADKTNRELINRKELLEQEKKKLSKSKDKLNFEKSKKISNQISKLLLEQKKTPKSFIYTINSGYIPDDHWTQDIKIGGGRLIGEACHFIDLLRYLCGSKIERYSAEKIGGNLSYDTFTINLGFNDGSMGSIHYFSNGGSIYPKEKLEIFFCDHLLFYR